MSTRKFLVILVVSALIVSAIAYLLAPEPKTETSSTSSPSKQEVVSNELPDTKPNEKNDSSPKPATGEQGVWTEIERDDHRRYKNKQSGQFAQNEQSPPQAVVTPPQPVAPDNVNQPVSQVTYTNVGNVKISSFSKAKKLLADIYSGDGVKSFYCGCPVSGNKIDDKACGLVFGSSSDRNNRLEWEHIVPAERFGGHLAAWKTGDPQCVSSGKPYKGRRCAAKVSADFQRMESDILNLFPEAGGINGRRSNYPFVESMAEGTAFGACDIKIGGGKAQAPKNRRGDIARTYLYMSSTYPTMMVLSSEEKKMFERWSAEDPVDSAEKMFASKKRAVQGNSNPYVENSLAH